jgi:MerR family mercuric resistance operon transcriptional regulator
MRVITTSRADGLPIGELSKLTGVNIETIRYYERIKMLPLPPRTAGGRRVYEPRELIRLGGPEKASCREVREIAAHHLDDIRAKIVDLRKLELLLAETVAQCTGTAAPVCPVLDILDIQCVPDIQIGLG